MIYSIYIIDLKNPGIPLIEYTFAPLDQEQMNGSKTDVFEEFFLNIQKTLSKIQAENQDFRNSSEFIRILVIEGLNVIIYFCGAGEFVICTINDLDDEKDKILDALQSLSRRFHQKHRTNIQEFRFSNQIKMFKPFKIDLINLTLNGTIGEEYPKRIVNDKTLERLQTMAVITDEEQSIARLCEGNKTPFKIAQILNMKYEKIRSVLEKLKNLDIIEQINSFSLSSQK